MDDFIKSLKAKEQELVARLEKSPLFIQLESLRKTISAFEENGRENGGSTPINGHTVAEVVSTDYNPNEFTWKDRVKYIIRKFGEASLAEIVKEIDRLEPNQYTKGFLDKRVGVTISQIKANGELLAKKVNKKYKYYLP